MSKENNGGPAFPCDRIPTPTGGRVITSDGMTLRDYFAAKAMQGMFASDTEGSVIETKKKAQFAYEMADAMLAEREK